MDGFNPGCWLVVGSFPLSVLYALDLHDDDEIIVNLMAWVIDTNKTSSFVNLQYHCKWKK